MKKIEELKAKINVAESIEEFINASVERMSWYIDCEEDENGQKITDENGFPIPVHPLPDDWGTDYKESRIKAYEVLTEAMFKALNNYIKGI